MDTPYEAAARKQPSERTTDEQALVDKATSKGVLSVKNLDHAARRTERYGTGS